MAGAGKDFDQAGERTKAGGFDESLVWAVGEARRRGVPLGAGAGAVNQGEEVGLVGRSH